MTSLPADEVATGHRPARAMLAGLTLFGVAAVLALAAQNAADAPAHAVVWAGLAMAAYPAGLLCLMMSTRGGNRGLASWRLGPWMMVWCGATYGLATVTWGQPQTGIAGEIALPSVLRALGLVATGTTMWAAGYFTGPGQGLRRLTSGAVARLHRRFSGDVRGPLTPWLLYAVGTVARVVSATTSGRLGYVGNAASAVSTASSYGQLVSLLTLCAPLGLAAAALRLFRQRPPGARLTLSVLFLAELGFDVASGQKQNFVVAVLAIAIPFSAVRHRLPKLRLAVLGLVFLVVIIPFTQAYREAARSQTGTLTAGQAVNTAPAILRQTLAGHGSMLSVLPSSLSYLLERSRDIDSPAIIMQRTPSQIRFASPADLVVAPLTALVPRALWPAKPILATGYQFGQQYFGIPPEVYSSTTITPIGDLYRHGGWIPVIVGMFLFGCGIRLLDDVADVRANPQVIFLILLLFPSFVMSEQDWITLLAAVPAYVLLWLGTVAVTFRGNRAVPRPGAAP